MSPISPKRKRTKTKMVGVNHFQRAYLDNHRFSSLESIFQMSKDLGHRECRIHKHFRRVELGNYSFWKSFVIYAGPNVCSSENCFLNGCTYDMCRAWQVGMKERSEVANGVAFGVDGWIHTQNRDLFFSWWWEVQNNAVEVVGFRTTDVFLWDD